MENLRKWLRHLLSFYLSITTITVVKFMPHIFRISVFVSVIDFIILLYYRFIGLESCTVDIDDQTSMHFWSPIHRKSNKPNLLIIHGYGSDSKWQMYFQVGPLAKSFNLYSPDLLFFGKSYTSRPDRSEVFQAKCVLKGMEKLGVIRYSVFGISYGGYVTYRMADMQPESLEKIMIASSGIGCTEEQKTEHLTKLGRNVADLLLPQKPEDLRLLVRMAFSKNDPFKWVPDFVLQQLINVMGKSNRKEKKELVEHLLTNEGGCHLPNIGVDTLLIWGDEVHQSFPNDICLSIAKAKGHFISYILRVFHQGILHFQGLSSWQLGPKARLQILKNTGHASNLESATQVNEFIKHFVFSKDQSLESEGLRSVLKIEPET